MKPEQIDAWLDANLHRMDLPAQYLGTEPNTYRKAWDAATLRWCLLASWPYEQAAGNSSIPAVYKAINTGRDDFLADRFYLPATPRDLRLLHRAGIGCFGIETKHPLRDFDIVATSISYPVLVMSFIKMLSVSAVPVRWRQRDPNTAPMVMAGGQGYGAPEVLAPVVDCWWLGEVEDEPGNPGITEVCAAIAAFKTHGSWHADRLGCYAQLARSYPFLYFPRFVDTHYHYQDRAAFGVGPQPSKQVAGVTANLPGMRMPRTRRYVHNLDATAPLDDPPLLFADPAMGCLAGDSVVITHAGPRRIQALFDDQRRQPEPLRVWTGHKGPLPVAALVDTGPRSTVTVELTSGHQIRTTPDHLIQAVPLALTNVQGRRSRRVPLLAGQFDQTRDRHATLTEHPRVWVEAQDLATGDYYIPLHYGQNSWSTEYLNLHHAYELHRVPGGFQPQQVQLPSVLNEDVARFLGVFCTDGRHHRHLAIGFSSDDAQPELRACYVQLLERLFGVTPTVKAVSDHTATVSISSVAVNWWLKANFGIVDLETRRNAVPDAILRSPRSVVAAFMSGVFDADGDIACSGAGTSRERIHSPRIATTRRQFADDLSMLINNLGAPTTLERETGKGRQRLRSGHESRTIDFWKVGIRASVDGSYDWLQPWEPSKANRLQRWVANRQVDGPARFRRDGLTYATVLRVTREVDQTRCFDLQVPGANAFTCNSMIVHNSGDLEVARGCPAFCSFCHLAWVTKPYRQRSVESTLAYGKAMHHNTGAVRLAPFAPDFPMHTRKKALVAGLLENVNDEVDAPTMRVDDFTADDQFMLLQVHGGMDTVTLGVEGNSQRMRDLVGKGTSDAEVCAAVARGIRAGIRKFKLFMITNLPGEDEGDIIRIVRLARQLADIREQLGQPTVVIQFSWTPLLVEANTPFQWFAPTPSNRVLADIFEELRDLKILYKIGSKAEPNKITFFQLCQRASRDVGEAIVDAIVEADQACWGGVPRTFKDSLDTALRRHGFHNGLADCFDERTKADMFGWEHIDTGVNTELLWRTYLQMREFLEQTDSRSYDQQFEPTYGGNEWVERCDSACQGRTCGACTHTDLKIRTGYIRAAATERHLQLAELHPVDQRSQAIRVRARIYRAGRHRFVGNDHWRFAIRRAAYRAQRHLGTDHGIAKRSIRFASDDIRTKDWSVGVDYVEFALTRHSDPAAVRAFLDAMNAELAGWLLIGEHTICPADAPHLRSQIQTAYYSLPIDADQTTITGRLHHWHSAPTVPMRLPAAGGYFAPATELVDAKTHVEDLWLVTDGIRLALRMLLGPRPNPYIVYAALAGRSSWIEAAAHPARRLDAFTRTDRRQLDFLRPSCLTCGLTIPVNPLQSPYHPNHCPRCLDQAQGITV